MTFQRKVILRIVVGLFILIMGVSYQYYYNEERLEHREELRAAYRKHYGKDPDPILLKYWTAASRKQNDF